MIISNDQKVQLNDKSTKFEGSSDNKTLHSFYYITVFYKSGKLSRLKLFSNREINNSACTVFVFAITRPCWMMNQFGRSWAKFNFFTWHPLRFYLLNFCRLRWHLCCVAGLASFKLFRELCILPQRCLRWCKELNGCIWHCILWHRQRNYTLEGSSHRDYTFHLYGLYQRV